MLLTAAWAWPRVAHAQAQVLPVLPPRVELTDALSELLLLGVHVPQEEFLTRFSTYLDSVAAAAAEVEQQAGSAVDLSAQAEAERAVTERDAKRTVQMVRAATQRGAGMLDVFLDALAPSVPSDEAERFQAFRDHCHIDLTQDALDVLEDIQYARHPQEACSWVRATCNPTRLTPEQRAGIAAALAATATQRRQASEELLRMMQDRQVAAARAAEKSAADNPPGAYTEISGIPDLTPQEWQRQASVQWETWKALRDHLPPPLRRYMAETYLTTLCQSGADRADWAEHVKRMLPVMLDSAIYSGGLDVIRTALALPGLTEQQRSEVRQECRAWVEARAAALEARVEAEVTGAAATEARSLRALDDAHRAKLAQVTGARWLMGRQSLSGDPAAAAALPQRSSLVLPAEDDASFPLPISIRLFQRATDAQQGPGPWGQLEPPTPRMRTRMLRALALTPEQEAVVQLVWNDALADWEKDVAPRFQKRQQLGVSWSQATTDWSTGNRVMDRGTDVARELDRESRAAWSSADAWHDGMIQKLRAALQAEKQGVAAVFVLGLITDSSLSPPQDWMAGIANLARLAQSAELSPAGRAAAVQEVERALPDLAGKARRARDLAEQDEHLRLIPPSQRGSDAPPDVDGAAAEYRRLVDAVAAAVKARLGEQDAATWDLLVASDRGPRVYFVWMTDASDELDAAEVAHADAQQACRAARERLKADAAAIAQMNQMVRTITDRLPEWTPRGQNFQSEGVRLALQRARYLAGIARDRRLIALARMRAALPPAVAGEMEVLSRLAPLDWLRRATPTPDASVPRTEAAHP